MKPVGSPGNALDKFCLGVLRSSGITARRNIILTRKQKAGRVLTFTARLIASITLFFGFWKIAGMPPGYRGDYLDLFDDVVALSGMASAVALAVLVRVRK